MIRRREWQSIPVFLPAEFHREAQWATVHGISESQTRLNNEHTLIIKMTRLQGLSCDFIPVVYVSTVIIAANARKGLNFKRTAASYQFLTY